MAELSGRKRGRALTRFAAAATAAVFVGTGADMASATDQPVPAPSVNAKSDLRQAAKQRGFRAQAPGAPMNALHGIDMSGKLYAYAPNGTGGLTARQQVGSAWDVIKHATQVDHNADGASDGVWEVNSGGHMFYAAFNKAPVSVSGGWGTYDELLSPGDLAGVRADDLIARDASGVLWLYLGYGDGKLTSRTRIGSGWSTYTQIAGQGDLTGDGKSDIVARDGAGVLWLYKGTGNRATPFAARTKVGAGWNVYNDLVSVGDIDIDGRTDLIARDGAGALWLYKGTGSAAAPYKARVKIGTSGWNAFRVLF